MTLKEASNNYADLAKNFTKVIIEAAVVPEANELLARTKNRIIVDGENSQGNDIGHYSKKEAYYIREQFVKKGAFKGRGKNGDTKFENGKPHRSMYFNDGYYGLRAVQGRPVNKVNLNYSGDTINRYQLEYKGDKITMGMTTTEAGKIRQGNEKLFNAKIYASSADELRNYNTAVGVAINKIMNEFIR